MFLVLILGVCFQDKVAEEAFKQLEETIRQAESVTVTVKYTTDLVPRGFDGIVRLLLKKGNKVSLECDWIRLGMRYHAFTVSDGTKTLRTGNGDQYDQTETPKNLKESFAISLVRVGGLYTALFATPMTADDLHSIPNFEKALSLSEFKATEDDGEAKTLTYKVVITHAAYRMNGKVVDIKIWYNDKFKKILKRRLREAKEGDQTTVAETTEIYEDFNLNTNILDEKFKLPAKK